MSATAAEAPPPVSPVFRSDLDVVTRTEDDGDRVRLTRLVVDPASGDVFELREEDYFICEQLDGERDANDVRSIFRQRFGLELEEEHLLAFLAQLGHLGLLEGPRPEASPFWQAALRFLDPDRWARWDLFHPGRLFAHVDAATRWTHTKVFGVLSVVVLFLGVGALLNNLPDFYAQLAALRMDWSWFELLAVYYFCVNLPSVLVQGTCAVHYGGRVDELGIRLLFDLLPIFYTKVRTEEVERRASCRVMFAPVRYGFVMAGFALVAWRLAPPATALPTFFVATALATAINATIRSNPLWATDTSHVLASWFTAPDLRTRSVIAWRMWVMERPATEPLTQRQARYFRLYGFAADVMTVLSIVGILYGVSLLVEATGGNGALLVLIVLLALYRRTWLSWFRGAPATEQGAA